jgi:hypothetical protein
VSLAVRSAFYRNLAVSVADWILISDVGSTNKLQLPAMFAFCDFVNEGDKFPWSSQISLRHVSHSKMRTLVLVSMFQRLSTKRDEEPQLGQLGLRDSADWLDSMEHQIALLRNTFKRPQRFERSNQTVVPKTDIRKWISLGALLLQFPQNAFPILQVERLRFSHGGEHRLGAPSCHDRGVLILQSRPIASQGGSRLALCAAPLRPDDVAPYRDPFRQHITSSSTALGPDSQFPSECLHTPTWKDG